MEPELANKQPADGQIPATPPENTMPMAENQAPVTPETSPTPDANADIIAKITKYLPDADVSTPEAILSSADELLGKLIVFQDKLRDVADQGDNVAAFLYDLVETGDLVKSIARNFSDEEKRALVEELESDDYEGDRKAYSDKIAETSTRREMVKKNMDISIAAISEFMEEKGWPENEAQEFEDLVIKHYDDGKDGLITKQDLMMLAKAYKHDDMMAEKETEVATAMEDGKAIGRNEQIVAKKISKEKENDLLPNGGVGMDAKPTVKPKPKSYGDKFLNGVI